MGTLKPAKSTSTLPAIIPGEQNKMILDKSLLLSEIILIVNKNDLKFNQNELQLKKTKQKLQQPESFRGLHPCAN